MSPIILTSYLISELLKGQRAFLARVICLIAVVANLVLIFSVCPMDIWGRPGQAKGLERTSWPTLDSTSTAAKFLIEENKKAVDEIKSRDEQEDSWFHNKFILVGGLLAAALGYLGFGPQANLPLEDRVTSLSKSESTTVILAVASVMVLGIDMHVRGNNCEVDQIGLWIRYYLEPVLLHGSSGAKDTKTLPPGFYGWEEFLRLDAAPSAAMNAVDWHDSIGAGKHSGELWNLFYVPHVHFLTAFVYLLYLMAFQTFAIPISKDQKTGRRPMSIICFTVVQTSIFGFAWIAHSAPEIFELKVLPFMPAYEAGYIAPFHYFVPCVALVILNYPFLLRYWKPSEIS